MLTSRQRRGARVRFGVSGAAFLYISATAGCAHAHMHMRMCTGTEHVHWHRAREHAEHASTPSTGMRTHGAHEHKPT